MWYLHSKGKLGRVFAKLLYLRIIHKYGCIIYPTAQVEKGFHITHPTGIVIGDCKIGKDFMIFQNCTIGTRKVKVEYPCIQDRVTLETGSAILGGIKVCNDVTLGAHSLAIKDILEAGTYAGNPLRRIDKK